MAGDSQAAITEVRTRLGAARSLAFLCGAGLSRASGVPTFRGAEGMWQEFRAEDLATPAAFDRDPLLVWRWYAARLAALDACRPNPGHVAIARALGDPRRGATAITQNVDGLQHRACDEVGVAAGDRILEVHGDIRVRRCRRCGREGRPAAAPTIESEADLPRCGACGDLQRPGVVWFGEMLDVDVLAAATRAAETCDAMIVAGTSGEVEPAASLARLAAARGACVIEVNPEPGALAAVADVVIAAGSEAVLPAILAKG